MAPSGIEPTTFRFVAQRVIVGKVIQFETHSSVRRNSVLIEIQPDATVCRYLFTAKSLYMFRVSQHPPSGVLKTVTANLRYRS